MARSDTGPFALVPEWLLDGSVNARAIVVYAVLSRYADSEGKAWPSRRALAKRLGCSEDTVDRAVAALVEAGALVKHHRRTEDGDLTSNEYTVLRVRRGGGRTAGTGPGETAAENESHLEREKNLAPSGAASASTSEEQEPLRAANGSGETPPRPPAAPPSRAHAREAPRPDAEEGFDREAWQPGEPVPKGWVKGRERCWTREEQDAVWDELIRLCGLRPRHMTRSQQSAVAKTVTEIMDVGANPRRLRLIHETLTEMWGGRAEMVTHHAIRQHWGEAASEYLARR